MLGAPPSLLSLRHADSRGGAAREGLRSIRMMCSDGLEERRVGPAGAESGADGTNGSRAAAEANEATAAVDVGGARAVTFAEVDASNVHHLKALNQVLFPVSYKDKFYRDCMAFPAVTQLAFFGADAVGEVACRLERAPDGAPGARLYIMTLGVLAPYRGLGIGGALLQRALSAVAFDSDIFEAYLHVQTSNEDAISFYEHFGFSIVGTIRNYYMRLDPPDCHVLSRRLVYDLHQHESRI